MSVMRMVRWLGGVDHGQSNVDGVIMTDDPLAAVIGPKMSSGSSISSPCAAFKKKQKEIYSVSRQVVLPRVALRNTGVAGGVGINPIFVDNLDCTTLPHKPTQLKHPPAPAPPEATPIQLTPSSGYGSHGGSSHDPIYTDSVKLREDAVAILEQNASFVKSILVAVKNKTGGKERRSVGSLGSSAAGTLSTIPEGKVDFTIPRPIWPKGDHQNVYDSLVDESVLLYTSLSYLPDLDQRSNANEILKDITETINLSKDGQMSLTPEQILKLINDKLILNREILQQTTEDEMRRLSVNLRNSERLNSVIRAFGSSSSACTPTGGEWTDIYQVPSSSSGYSENALPVFVHEDLTTVPNGVRNALIYGTLCRGSKEANERLLGTKEKPKESLLAAAPDAKPSVWQFYYGASLRDEERGDCNTSGRPEADFTLDVPRSELLSRRMKRAKKWRFRCRIVTSFLGLVFFLLSLMAVSLILTRGKRMFGSMV